MVLALALGLARGIALRSSLVTPGAEGEAATIRTSFSAVTPPGAGRRGQDTSTGMESWRSSSPPYREFGVDKGWDHCLVVVDRQSNIIEEWTQWDELFKRPPFQPPA